MPGWSSSQELEEEATDRQQATRVLYHDLAAGEVACRDVAVQTVNMTEGITAGTQEAKDDILRPLADKRVHDEKLHYEQTQPHQAAA